MAFIETCLKQCAHLEVIEATGFGGIEGAFHMNDLLSLLRMLNRMRPSPQVHNYSVLLLCLNILLPISQTTFSGQRQSEIIPPMTADSGKPEALSCWHHDHAECTAFYYKLWVPTSKSCPAMFD